MDSNQECPTFEAPSFEGAVLSPLNGIDYFNPEMYERAIC